LGAGEGAVTKIVYLHGFASSPASKKARFFAARFAEMGVTIDIPDLADGDFDNLTIGGMLRVLERATNGEPAILIGSSLGGYLAALYAARHDEVEKLVLMAPAFSFNTRWRETLGAEAMDRWKETGYLSTYHYGDGRQRKLSYQLVDEGRGYEDYPNFPQPAILFHGEHDTVVPPGYSITFSQQHESTRLYLVDSDHELWNVTQFMWEKTQEFLAVPL